MLHLITSLFSCVFTSTGKKLKFIVADFLDDSIVLIGNLQVILKVQNFQSRYLRTFFLRDKTVSILCACM